MKELNKQNKFSVFCPNCGQQCSTDANFCGKCGASLKEPRTQPESGSLDRFLQRLEEISKPFLRIALIVLVALCIYIAYEVHNNPVVRGNLSRLLNQSSQSVTTSTRTTSTSSSDPAEGKTCTITGEYVSLRSGAGVKYSKLGTVYKGNTFRVQDVRTAVNGQKWYKISANGKTGWVHAAFASVNGSTSSIVPNGRTDSISDANGLVGKTLVITSSYSVRTKATGSASQLGQVESGQRYQILDLDTSETGKIWFKIRFEGRDGWVSASAGTVNGYRY